jgi:ethanolamine transporter EutH
VRPQPFIMNPMTDFPIASSARVHLGGFFRIALAISIGVVVGAVTEWSALHLPFSLEPLANSAAPWIIVAFVVALTARRIAEALMLAVVTLLALVSGFYAVQAYRGWSVPHPQVELWLAASVAIGPLVGLAAGWLRHAGRTAGALGAGVIGGLVAGEAIYGLTVLRFSSSSNYWHVQFVIGVAIAVGLSLWRSRRHMLGSFPTVAVSLAACATVGLATLVVYQVP